MKIAELLEDLQPRSTKSDYAGTVERLYKTRSKTGISNVGGGTYGKVYELPGDSMNVTKVARHPHDDPSKDGYFGYIKRLVQLENPYFPQVDELQLLKSRDDGTPFYKVRIEKLEQLATLEAEQVHAIVNRIFGRALSDEEYTQFVHQHVPPARRGKEANSEALASFLESCVENTRISATVKDPELIKAIQILRLFHKHGYILDIHNENIMLRRTPYGGQVVFTDPFTEIRRQS